MGTRGETLYYLFHKSRATPVSPGLLTQSWPLIGQCCSVPSSDWRRGLHHQPAPISPLNTEYVTIEKTEQSTTTSQHQQDLNNFANYASITHCSSHKIDNTSNFNIKTHSEIGWHAILKIIQCLPTWMKTNNQRICRFNFSFVALNTLWHFTVEFLWLGLRKQECEYDWFEPHYRRVSWSMECRARAFCRIVASSEWGGSKIISYT